MEILLISVLSIFSVIGFVTVVKELIYERLNPRKIVLHTLNDENKIEYIVRTLKKQYPSTDIFIKDSGSSDDTIIIAEKAGAMVENT